MTIGIQHTKGSFSERWISYCEDNKIPFKKVDCYRNDILIQLDDCDALMWHFSQDDERDILFAKQLLYSVQMMGKKVFPDFHTMWHFDDKIGQKYLFESINAPFAPTWIFFDLKAALQWIDNAVFPKVFKLRCGAGSKNVRLVLTKRQSTKLVKKAFNKGLSSYDALGSLKERWRLFRLKKTNLFDVLKGIVRFCRHPKIARVIGPEIGYVYFQEFISKNDYDIRVIVIRNRAFAIKRIVRKKDFRASGSGRILYDKNAFDENTVKLSFSIAEKLKSQSAAFDFVYSDNKPVLLEVSYGFFADAYDKCEGYWDNKMNWHAGQFNPYGWMVESVIDCKK
ncbi:RimK family alpha-L-glutamate ligase [Thermodesulfobacteriota bacterium]